MQLFDALPPHIEDALRASIERFGVLVPIIVWRQTGEVLDGNHRKRIADDLGVECPKRTVDAADEAEARDIAVTLNMDRRHLDRDQRLEMVAHLREQGHSIPAIAGAVGVGKSTVGRDVDHLSRAGKVDQPGTVRGLDGKQYPSTRPTPEPANPEPDRLAPMMSSDTPEWYTPDDILVRADKVLSGIDLDPCSNPGTPNVNASRHYTAADDGLSLPWPGTVYMNPPYGRGIDRWVQKLADEHDAGRTTSAIALVPARTDTRWFRILRDCLVCFIDGRLKFANGTNDTTDPAPFPSAAFYLGPDVALFAETFDPIGDVYARWGQ